MYETNQIDMCESKDVVLRRANVTVGENIDLKIKQLQDEIVRLESSKTTLGPLLAMKICDIRDAMNY